ncbi:DUF221-domain-containing protein [Piromyces finnis]|uniref:DUF221-domain-containing protein n=1 Tax=Piromyces finnis TaxID=1754191 RepID=A0A1Y1V1N8_9FUNG|nr:DUF221-domain-containing protein [Piromyces finnis]|eukprot:ORX45213.1 DUF221-domain-containing protein [Piromyces finnis]
MENDKVESIIKNQTSILVTTATTVTETIVSATSSLLPTQTQKPAKTVEEEYKLHPNVEKSTSITTLITPFILYFGTGLLLFFGFCILRNYFKIFYMPRRRLKRCAPPRIPSGLFTWIMVVLRLKTSYVLPIVGVDAEVFLLFLKMAMKLFFTIGVLALFILVPVNYASQTKSSNDLKLSGANETSADIKLLEQITIDNIPEGSNLLIFHILFSWIFSLIAFYYLFSYYNKCREIRIKYIANCYNNNYKQLVNFRSIMIFGLPKVYRNEEKLYNFFSDLGIGDLENVVICKRYLHLRKALDNRQYYLNKIESYYTNWIGYKNLKKNQKKESKEAYNKMKNLQNLRNGHNNFKKMTDERTESESSIFSIVNASSTINLFEDNEPKYDQLLVENKIYFKERKKGRLYVFGDKIDLFNYYVEKFIKWDNNVRKLRNKVNNSTTPVAFVTFKSPLSALIGAQCLLHEKPFTCFVSLAPEPRDIYWKNISNRLANPYTKLLRAVLVIIISAVIITIWFIPLMLITSLTDINSLQIIVPFIKSITEKMSPVLISLINNALSMIILATWLSFLPDILMLLSEIQGIETYSWLEKALLKKYFFYQIFNVILFFIIGKVAVKIASIWEYIDKTPFDLLKMLATSLIKLSPFYINYTMLQTFLIISVQLIYPAPIAKSIFAWLLKFIHITKTPRTYSNLSDPRTFSLNYGYISTLPLVLFTVVMVFSCICPIIPCMGVLYFSYAFLVYKYQLMYIQHPRYESYGSFVPLYINRCLFAIFIFQLTMFSVLTIKLSMEYNSSSATFSNLPVLLFMILLLLSTMFVSWWFKQSFDKHFKFLPLEVIAKHFNRDNCIVNSTISTIRTDTSAADDQTYTYCSYCGSHDVITSKTPFNKHRSNSNSSLKDISALRRRTSLERDYSSTEIHSMNGVANIKNVNDDKEMNNNHLQNTNVPEERSDVNSNYLKVNNNGFPLNNKQNQQQKSPLGKGKQPSHSLYNEESGEEQTSSSENFLPTINVDENYSNISNVSSGRYNKKFNEVTRLNVNFKNNRILSSPPSARYFGQDSSNPFNNVPTTNEVANPSKRKHIRSESNVNIRDKYSSRKWIFDEYTDYHQPRSERVNGICDIPWDVYQLNGGFLNSVDDDQLYCYEHPALIGPLPTLWLPNKMNTGRAKGEDLMKKLINEYKRVHADELTEFDNEDEQFNSEYIAEEIECGNDNPPWINKINRKIYRLKKKVFNLYTSSLQQYIDYIVQWLNFGLR